MAKKRKPRSVSDMQMIKDAKRGKVSKYSNVTYLDVKGIKDVLGFNISNLEKNLEKIKASMDVTQPKADTKHPSYINKQCKTEHGTGFVCGIDLPESRAWRLLVKITDNTGVKINEGMFPDSILAYSLNEVEFLSE